MISKARISASVDTTVVEAGRDAVARGLADSFSAWVNDALHRRSEHDRRMDALAAFLAAYEAEHGEITDEEIGAATRRAREKAIVVRGHELRPRSGRGAV